MPELAPQQLRATHHKEWCVTTEEGRPRRVISKVRRAGRGAQARTSHEAGVNAHGNTAMTAGHHDASALGSTPRTIRCANSGSP